jgi:hypothetical protein
LPIQKLTEAFASVYALKYKYNGAKVQVQTAMVQNLWLLQWLKNLYLLRLLYFDTKDVNLLYAQATSTGYQLIDSTPKVVMKLLKHHKPTLLLR